MAMNTMQGNPYGQPPAAPAQDDPVAEMNEKLDYIIQMLEAATAEENDETETEDSTGGESD